MGIVNINKQVTNYKVPKGTVLLLQGERGKAISILHSGMAELLSYSQMPESCAPGDIIANSRRVGLVKGESIYGVLNLRSEDQHSKSVRALTECIISIIPITTEDIFNRLKGDIRLNLQILRALIQRIDSGTYLLGSYKALWKNLNNIAVGIAMTAEISPDAKNFKFQPSFPEYKLKVKKIMEEKKINFPGSWDPNVFLKNMPEKLELSDELEGVSPEDIFDNKQFLFLKRLLRAPDQSLIDLFKQDEPITFYIYQFFSEALTPLMDKNEEVANKTYDLIDTLFSDQGWLFQVINQQGFKNKQATIFNHYMGRFCWKYRKDIIQLMGIDLKAKYPVYSNLQYFSNLNPVAIKEADDKPSLKEEDHIIKMNEGVIAKFKNLTNRILEFSYMGDEFNKSFLDNMAKFKASKNRFENEPKLNSLKRRISDQYWQLYERCFMKVIETGLTNFLPGIMLHFGVLDEELVEPGDLVFLDQAFSKSLYNDTTYPVMTLPYFLEKIYKEEVNPSINDMGQSFQEVLRKQGRPSRKGGETHYQDTVEDRVKFELDKVIKSCYRMIFGSVATAFPIFCSETLIGPIDRCFLDPESVIELVKHFHDRDFSMFYRDIVVHLKFGTEIIKKEVIPNFVLYPVFGTKMISWQELDGPKRETKGRMFMPLFFGNDKEKYILNTIGQFRWELQRVMAGANWMDPVEGGLSGAYYDYITFYKKNPNLSMTAKEKLRDFVKKTRSDKDRFVFDYTMWVLNEYEGIPKLNNVSREIFYKHCPFRKEDRDRLNQRPAFSNLEIKYQNIAKRNILKMESRVKKYEKSGTEVPSELTDYLGFLKL